MPRSFSHWTPRYIRDRVAVMIDERANPANPWLTRDAVRFLDEALRITDVGLEFGSGRSSIWFGRRIKHLTSIEDNPEWFERVTGLITAHGLTEKIDYRFRRGMEQYVGEVGLVADESIDFCLVDGSHRDECAVRLVAKIRRGGLLVVDNINWYLPSDAMAPSSRRPADGYASASWAAFASAVQGWRRYWTSNGVTSTCIWFKP
jgi:predicted O-methyltransferase YrrM